MQYVIWLKQNNNQSNHCQVPKMTVYCKWVLREINEKYQVTPSQNACDKESATRVLHSSNTSCIGGAEFTGRLTAATISKSKKWGKSKPIPLTDVSHLPQKAHQFTCQVYYSLGKLPPALHIPVCRHWCLSYCSGGLMSKLLINYWFAFFFFFFLHFGDLNTTILIC